VVLIFRAERLFATELKNGSQLVKIATFGVNLVFVKTRFDLKRMLYGLILTLEMQTMVMATICSFSMPFLNRYLQPPPL